MAVYVYAITSAAHPLRLDDVNGVGDPPEQLRTVDGQSLVAVVSDAPEGLKAKRRDVLAHQSVLERVMADGSVLPLRFGALAPDDEAVRQVLDEGADEYRERLSALDGCVEFHLKASCAEEALLRDILLQNDEARRINEDIRSGRGGQDLRMALGELVAAEVQRRHEVLAAETVEALRPQARDVRTSDPTGDDFVSVSFLVEQAGQNEFMTAEKELADRRGEDFAFRLHGPLPPYSFV
ncbi:gas vesicle protein [Streptomyces agglomeratus]|uniref:Gas vesicle protein n=1 Tax=Streptomyces agglomeratus TaxID=285458 RepID=A0A1E5PF27_9ACTN|nr:GvpL/GvpF family gas vesicle protein [Streptomyces agglomeratus]OEJ28129.1 gas vesicle protein [Streptomyces agglomeratus]OEJ57673.1 gas vesicle protein [Streptomyces agglomeratus]